LLAILVEGLGNIASPSAKAFKARTRTRHVIPFVGLRSMGQQSLVEVSTVVWAAGTLTCEAILPRPSNNVPSVCTFVLTDACTTKQSFVASTLGAKTTACSAIDTTIARMAIAPTQTRHQLLGQTAAAAFTIRGGRTTVSSRAQIGFNALT